MTKKQRKLRSLLEREGILIHQIRTTKNNHTAFKIITSKGFRTVIAANTTSDHRSQRNLVSLCRRLNTATNII